MSLLDQVREKYKTPREGAARTDESSSVSFVSPRNSGSESFEPANAPKSAMDFDQEKVRRDSKRGAEERRKRLKSVLDMMAEDDQPRKHYWATDDKAHPEFVFLTLAIRDVGTCEMSIPKEKYDPFLLMNTLDQHNRNGVDS